MKNSHKGISRLVSAFGYSLSGFKAAYAQETAFRQEVWLLIAATITAFCVDVTAYERFALIASVVLVLIVELLNTGVETLGDRISEEYDPYVKKAKDAGSAAVLLALLLAVSCWTVILL